MGPVLVDPGLFLLKQKENDHGTQSI